MTATTKPTKVADPSFTDGYPVAGRHPASALPSRLLPRDAESRTSRITAAGTAGLQVLSIDLVVLEGPSIGDRVEVRGGVARVGSAEGNELCLADPTVSRIHCELRSLPERVLLKDCGSTNGTFVEGVRVRTGELRPGASVRVGNSVFRIESRGGSVFLPISDQPTFGELVGASVHMRRVYAMLERIAPTNATLLIEGETGTGKDVVARSLHDASARPEGPFVPVDCGAIPENLIESELFGHVRGAFSGALADRKGVFEEADGGTLFLDEIGEMPLSVQPKLLRAIETRTVRRVGDNVERPVDVRLVAATNRSLATCANQGTFREDLYYRLAVIEVRMPPLRTRPEDIALLAQHFYSRFTGTDAPLSPSFLAMLTRRNWPGNVRELRNFMERSVSLGQIAERALTATPTATTVATTDLDSIVPTHLPLKDARQAWTRSFESIYVRTLLNKTGGNVTRAAELAGVNRRFLQRLMSRLGVNANGSGEDE